MRYLSFLVGTALAALGLACSKSPTEGGLDPPPPSVSLSANPTVVTLPGNTTLTAQIKNAVSCSSSWSGNVPSSDGTFPISITTAGITTFSLTCTNVGGVSKTAEVTVEGRDPPRMNISIVGALPTTEKIPTGMRARIEQGSAVEVVDFDQLGKASFVYANEGSLCITIDAVNTNAREFYPTRACVERKDFNKDQIFVLIPFGWNGVSVDLAEALDTTGTQAGAEFYSFYWWNPYGNAILYQTKTWQESRLPIPVAYNRGKSTVGISQAESDSIKGIIDRLNLELGKSRTGKNFFKYGPFEDLKPQGDLFEGISLVVDSTSRYVGVFGGLRFTGYSLISGHVITKITGAMLHEGILKHELLHGLGAGHTQRWPSIMNNNPGYCGTPSGCFSPQQKDVLYIQLLHRVREVQLMYNAQYEIPEANQGYRVVVQGLSPQVIVKQ